MKILSFEEFLRQYGATIEDITSQLEECSNIARYDLYMWRQLKEKNRIPVDPFFMPHQDREYNPYQLINYSLHWVRTKEGDIFWRKIDDAWRSYLEMLIKQGIETIPFYSQEKKEKEKNQKIKNLLRKEFQEVPEELL